MCYNAIKGVSIMLDYKKMISITPYKELRGGKECIHEHIQKGYAVPNKVIAYLQTGEPFTMSPGIYEHPFKAGKRLLGPYRFTDGKSILFNIRKEISPPISFLIFSYNGNSSL